MAIELSNRILKLEIQEPGEFYRGTRFDWTGQIIQIVLDNTDTFCTAEFQDPALKDTGGRGLYNEFGIDMPVGYDDCKTGEQFIKIGTGLLTRDSKPYDFFKKYEITPFAFQVEKKNQGVYFTCDPRKAGGYAVKLEKQIILNNNIFTIRYNLTNTGSKVIRTNEYIHNFLSLNNKNIDMYYKLTFSFLPEPAGFEESINPGNVVVFENEKITWKNDIDRQFFFSNLSGSQNVAAGWSLEHSSDRIGIRERCSFTSRKVNLWGSQHVVSPEIFYEIDLPPGKSGQWERIYEVYRF